MKKLLVPCDFSKPAVDAFRVALTIAKRAKASVHLLYVIELPVLADSVLVPVADYEVSMKNDMQAYAQKKFSRLIEKYGENEHSIVTAVKFGQTVSTIIRTIEDGNFDLVVMGSHGASGMREFFIGSNTERIVRFSAAPVLVVKNYYLGPVKNIVMPCSTEIETDDFVAKVKELQHFYDSHLHIVWINTPGNFVSDVITRKRLNEFAKSHKLKNYTIATFNEVNEMDGILYFSKMVSADMIIMATHGRKGIAHLFQGSLTEDVVNHAPNLLWTYTVKSHPKSEKWSVIEEGERV